MKPKPTGPIPLGYSAIDGELAIGGKPASHWVDQADPGDLPTVFAKALRLAL